MGRTEADSTAVTPYVLLTHTSLRLQSTPHPSEGGVVSITAVLAPVYVGGLPRGWWDLAFLSLSPQMAMEGSTGPLALCPKEQLFLFFFLRVGLT